MIEDNGTLNSDPGRVLAFDFADQTREIAKIRVVGVGGAGGNAVNRMITDGLNGVDFIAMNTDLQALEQNQASCRIQIGKNLTKGLGAGGNPEIGRKAIEETKDTVIDALSETDMVLITCGMGGGTGTGAAPVVAEIAKDLGALTVGIVTKPFVFEGGRRNQKAEQGMRELKEYIDTMIINSSLWYRRIHRSRMRSAWPMKSFSMQRRGSQMSSTSPDSSIWILPM